MIIDHRVTDALHLVKKCDTEPLINGSDATFEPHNEPICVELWHWGRFQGHLVCIQETIIKLVEVNMVEKK